MRRALDSGGSIGGVVEVVEVEVVQDALDVNETRMLLVEAGEASEEVVHEVVVGIHEWKGVEEVVCDVRVEVSVVLHEVELVVGCHNRPVMLAQRKAMMAASW